LLGFLGLLLAVPTAAIIGVLVRHAVKRYKLSSLYLD
jgi:predicted PurR-regulated permease PerM